ncbi:hypothetical protein Pelo_2542 [Pelomyxa schiedti]|nr:hypothetical protein Pelo_2542 [Pelomyxa schiedti]
MRDSSGGVVLNTGCRRCGAEGHVARACSRPRRCDHCGRIGHVRAYCPDRLHEILCHRCGLRGHYANDCTSETPSIGGTNGSLVCCHSCNKPGHFMKECPSSGLAMTLPRHISSLVQNSTNSSTATPGSLRCCDWCGRTGHVQRDCPFRLADPLVPPNAVSAADVDAVLLGGRPVQPIGRTTTSEKQPSSVWDSLVADVIARKREDPSTCHSTPIVSYLQPVEKKPRKELVSASISKSVTSTNTNGPEVCDKKENHNPETSAKSCPSPNTSEAPSAIPIEPNTTHSNSATPNTTAAIPLLTTKPLDTNSNHDNIRKNTQQHPRVKKKSTNPTKTPNPNKNTKTKNTKTKKKVANKIQPPTPTTATIITTTATSKSTTSTTTCPNPLESLCLYNDSE